MRRNIMKLLQRLCFAMPLVACWGPVALAAGQKICSPIESQKWRTVTPVPREWTGGDCRSFSESIGATQYKLGCLFSETIGEKYSWSVEVKSVDDETAPPPPPRNCGW
jgi:hypothetical protein